MKLSKGAREDQIIELISTMKYPFPPDYVSFLKFSNGAIGRIGHNYLEICKVEEIIQLNEDYSVKLYAPGLILFGTDGGGEGYGFDFRGHDPVVVEIPFIGMDWKEARTKGENFLVFLENLDVEP